MIKPDYFENLTDLCFSAGPCFCAEVCARHGAAEVLTGAEAFMEAEVHMEGTLTEAAASTAEATPVSAGADNPTAVLAAGRQCRPLGWAGGT